MFFESDYGGFFCTTFLPASRTTGSNLAELTSGPGERGFETMQVIAQVFTFLREAATTRRLTRFRADFGATTAVSLSERGLTTS